MSLSRRAQDLFPKRLTYRYWLPKVTALTLTLLLSRSFLVAVNPQLAETNPQYRTRKVVLLGPKDQAPRPIISEFRFGKDRTFLSAVQSLELRTRQVEEILEGFRPKQDRLIHLPKGARLVTEVTPAPIRQVERVRLELAPEYVLELKRAEKPDEKSFARRRFELVEAAEDYTIKVRTYSNTVKTSIWESAAEVKMDHAIIADMAEIFAWQVDFSREVRPGDRWRLAVEERYLRGERVGWGRILAAEFENDGEDYTALLYRRDWNEVGYFTPEGTSLKRIFLKNPIAYRRISSRFSTSRLHPILGRNRAHRGVDYAAPRGTPVRAVGDGEIVVAKFDPEAGKILKIRHADKKHMTAYKHLAGFAPEIMEGVRVKQGQIIGYVGSTGLATGPHLHFEFYQNGKYIDPLGKRWPSADPVTDHDRPVFEKFAYAAMRVLPAWVNPPTAQVLSQATGGRVPAGVIPPSAMPRQSGSVGRP